MGSFRELIAYKRAFGLSMEIFQETKSFPKEEMYSLIDQIRRSSRSVFACIAEAYKKRRYPIILSVSLRTLTWKMERRKLGSTLR